MPALEQGLLGEAGPQRPERCDVGSWTSAAADRLERPTAPRPKPPSPRSPPVKCCPGVTARGAAVTNPASGVRGRRPGPSDAHGVLGTEVAREGTLWWA